MIAALFVQRGGVYWDLPDVDPWDESRDARLYPGPWPVVAHPPCSRWCQLAGLVEARWGHKKGDDGGCFASALSSVRRFGGVLEHPAWSEAYLAYGLGEPDARGGWQRTLCGGWTCAVEQWRYGHAAKKATWLYAHGMDTPPPMRWGFRADSDGLALVERWGNRPHALVSWCGNHVASGEKRPRLSKKAASATPIEFRDALLDIARLARRP